MVGFELRAQATLCQLFLQVAVELQRIVLCHNYAYLLVLRCEVPEYALRHTFESAENKAVRNNDTFDKGFESTAYIVIAEFKLHVATS